MGQAGRTGVRARAGSTIPEQRAPSSTDRLQELKQLGDLKAQGVLTEEEFAAEKAKILAS